MKSPLLSSLILLTLSVSLVSCQEAETFSVKSATSGSISVSEPETDANIFCEEAKDLDSCLAQKDLCQPAFEDALDGAEKPYAGCIANPNVGENISEDPIKTPDAPVVVADPIKVPDAPVVVADPVAPVIVVEEPKEVVKDIADEDEEEILDIANAGDCSKLDPKYIFSKSKGQIKVKICHSSADGAHAIIVACPALKAHVKHHNGKDYLGACTDE